MDSFETGIDQKYEERGMENLRKEPGTGNRYWVHLVCSISTRLDVVPLLRWNA